MQDLHSDIKGPVISIAGVGGVLSRQYERVWSVLLIFIVAGLCVYEIPICKSQAEGSRSRFLFFT